MTKKPLLVHFGCGEIDRDYFYNVDARALPHVDQIAKSVFDLENLKENSVELFYACHVIEHMPYNHLKSVFDFVFKKLKKRGVFRVSVPDFDSLLKIYNSYDNDIEMIIGPLMGRQNYSNNFHFSAFNKNYLHKLFKDAGFSTIQFWEPSKVKYHDFDDWANKTYLDKKISLNIEGIK